MSIVAGVLAIISYYYIQDFCYRYALGNEPVSLATVSPYIGAAGAAMLAALAALVLRGRARWLVYSQLALWLIPLAGSIVAYASSHTLFKDYGPCASTDGPDPAVRHPRSYRHRAPRHHHEPVPSCRPPE